MRREIPAQSGGPHTGANPVSGGPRGDVRPAGSYGGPDTGSYEPVSSEQPESTVRFGTSSGATEEGTGPDKPRRSRLQGPTGRMGVLLAAAIYLVDVAAATFFAYDLFGKFFDLIHNRCSAKRDFTVQCVVERPASGGLWGLLLGGGGMSLALMAALVLTALAAMTGRRAWIYPALALPLILISGAIGHFLVGGAIS